MNVPEQVTITDPPFAMVGRVPGFPFATEVVAQPKMTGKTGFGSV